MKISIVIPSRNRAHHLEKTLESLRSQTLEPNRYEVVVCDHGSSDDTDQLCARYSKHINIKYAYLPYKGYDIAGPKNEGIRHADNELIILLDSGIICPPNFLKEHIIAHRKKTNPCVYGPVYGWDCETEDEFWKAISSKVGLQRETIPSAFKDSRFRWVSRMKSTPWMLFWGCNVSVARDMLVGVGRFDSRFKGWGWDDLELGYRLYKKGGAFIFAKKAWCLHYPHPRSPLKQRLEEARTNWIRTYEMHVAPELELWEICSFENYGIVYEKILKALSGNVPILPEESASTNVQRLKDGTLYWGFQPRAQNNSNTILSPLPLAGDEEAFYSFGIRTPFARHEFDQVHMSSYWQSLLFQADKGRELIIYYILKEAARVGKRIRIEKTYSINNRALQLLQRTIRKLREKEELTCPMEILSCSYES